MMFLSLFISNVICGNNGVCGSDKKPSKSWSFVKISGGLVLSASEQDDTVGEEGDESFVNS
jgi:hypothetical protein